MAVESRAKAFPSALARFLRWRDLSCRGPFCNAAIRQSDHIVPRSAGGPTSIDNGQGACAHDNGKEEHFHSVRRIPKPPGGGHRVEWISPNGISRTTSPPSLTRPVRLPAAPLEPSALDAGPPDSGPSDDGLLPDSGPSDDGPPSDSPSEVIPPDEPPYDVLPGAPPDDQLPVPDQRE